MKIKLEIGKYYKHNNSGKLIAVRAKVNTTMWNETLVVESSDDIMGLQPIAENLEGFQEIDEKEWLEFFKNE